MVGAAVVVSTSVWLSTEPISVAVPGTQFVPFHTSVLFVTGVVVVVSTSLSSSMDTAV